MGCKCADVTAYNFSLNSWALTMWDVNTIQLSGYKDHARGWALTMCDVNMIETLSSS